MTTRQMAELIPAEYRTEILEMDMVSKATANRSDKSMLYLFTIWKNYVDPGGFYDESCALCIEETLKKWKLIQADLISLEREGKLLALIRTTEEIPYTSVEPKHGYIDYIEVKK